jgi:thiol:disulfide interchange protein DsbA
MIKKRRQGMKVVKIFVPVIMFLFIAHSSYADKKPNIVGIYSEMAGKEFHFDGKTVEIVEFLSFYCGHCYHLEKSVPVIKGNFPKKTNWKIIPIYWGKGSPKPGEAYLIAEEEGKGPQMKAALFNAIFVDKRDIGNITVLEDLGMKVGLGFDFSRKLRAGEKADEAGKALDMARSYGIQETPTLIIAGNLKVTPGLLNNDVELVRDNVIVILKSLFR